MSQYIFKNFAFPLAPLVVLLGACGGGGSGGGDSSPRPVSPAPPPVVYSYTPTAEIVDVIACTAPGQPVAACTAADTDAVVRDPAEAVGTPTSAAAQWLEIDFTSTPAGGPAQGWTVSASAEWVQIATASGTATAGEPTRVALTADCPVAGARTADLSLALGGQTVTVPWAVSCRPGVLSISGLEIYQGPLTRVWAGPEAGWRPRVPPPYGVRMTLVSDRIPHEFEPVSGTMAVEMPMLEIAERQTLMVIRVAHESPETPALRVSVEGGDGGLLAEWLPGDEHVVRHHTLPPGEIASCEGAGAPHPWCLGAGDPEELPGSEYRPVELPPRDASMHESEYRIELAGAVLCTGATAPHVDCTAADQILDGLWKAPHAVRIVVDPFDAIGKSPESVWDMAFPVERTTAWRASNDHDERFDPWPASMLREYPVSIPVELPTLDIALVPLVTVDGQAEFGPEDIDRYLSEFRRWMPVGRHRVRVTPPLAVSHRGASSVDGGTAFHFQFEVGRVRLSDEGPGSFGGRYIGIYPGTGAGFAVPTRMPYLRILGRTSDGPYNWDHRQFIMGGAASAPSFHPRSIAHELGHLLALLHPPCGELTREFHWPRDSAYVDARPGPNRLYRFDDDGGGGFVHWAGAEQPVVDLMSYCHGTAVLSDWYYGLAAMWRAAAADGGWVPCRTPDASGVLPDWAVADCAAR